jgi:hypothetical protein
LCSSSTPNNSGLLPQYLLDLADFFLNFASYLFDFSFDFQLGAFAEFTGDLTQCYPSLPIKSISETTVWDNSLRFSARTFIRVLSRIMQILTASGKPTAGKRQEAGIIL